MKTKRVGEYWVTTFTKEGGHKITGAGKSLGASWLACIEGVAREAM